ncbi:MAG: C40 family peptidase [Dokdonella sp.]
MRNVLVVVLFTTLLCACASKPSHRSTATSTRAAGSISERQSSHLANAVLFRALALVGTPYRYGGNTPESGFDCSGLVGYVFRDAAAISLPRTSAQIGAVEGKNLRRDDLIAGDLVLFATNRNIHHVGIYVGEQRFVHAPNSGGTVRMNSLDEHGWRETFSYGKRLIR